MNRERFLTRDDLLDSWLAAEASRQQHPDFTSYYHRRAWAIGHALVSIGPPVNYARCPREHRMIWGTFMSALRLHNELVTPWGLILIGVPRPEYVEVKERHEPAVTATIDQLKAAYRTLLLDLMERIWGIGTDLAVAADELREHGFDPDEMPPDPDEYW